MKEFKYCHEEITEGVEIPVTVCETQKEMVGFIVNYRDDFKFAMERLDEVMKSRENGGFDYEDVFGRMKRNERAYHEAIDRALSGTDEETVYIIYKDGSTYFQNGGIGCEGKFKRTGIARAMISTAYEVFVFGDFAINDMGDVTIEGSEIEEYGVYAGQYDVKEQDEQEAQEKAEENKDTFEYRNYIISGNERTGIIAIDNHGNFSPKVYKTVEEAKKAVDEDIEYAEKKYAEMEAEQTEVEETAEIETAKPETAETDDSGFEYTTSQAQEIIMTGTSIAREKYREKHGIHSPMDLKKFSKKQLDDYLSKELDYINKFLNDTLPKEVFNAMKGEIMYA